MKTSKMKTISLILILIAGFFVQSTFIYSSQDIDPSKLKYPELKEIEIPTPEQFVLPNGMKFLLIEDHRLPLIELSVIVKASSYYDPALKTGLAGLTGAVMRTGGTKSMSGDEIDLKLETLAATVETYIGDDSGGAYLNCLKDNFDTSLAILVDILKSPRFDKEKINQEKVQLKSAISRRNDEIGQVTGREFQRLLWGKDSVKGRMMEYDTIDNIKKSDLIAFHKKYFVPNNMILGVVGDFDTDEMKEKLTKAFQNWKESDLKLPRVQIHKSSAPGINYIQKEDTTQSNVRLGYVAPEMQFNNPDFPAVTLMNYILGASFSSRLFKEVRTDKGLAYDVSGGFNFSFDEPGIFMALCQTKLESTTLAIDTIIDVVNKMKTVKPTEKEFYNAKNAYLNSFVFMFEKNKQILNRQLNLSFYGYPTNFYSKFMENLGKVTVDDISRVANKYIDTSNLTILVVGKKDGFDKPLDKYGKVHEIDIKIPEPKASPIPAATPETLKAGKDLMSKVFNKYGGIETLKANKTRIEEFTLSIVTIQGEFTMQGKVHSTYPHKQHRIMTTPMGKIVMVFNGKNGWQEMGGRSQDLTESQIADTKNEIHRELRWWAHNFDKIVVYTAGNEKIENKDTTKLIIKYEDELVSTIFIEKDTSRILKRSYMGKAATTGAPAFIEIYHYDFKIVSKILIPFRSVINENGKKAMETKITKVELNVQINEDMFRKPVKK